MEKGKRGPKTDNPKTHKITVKLDDASKEILDTYMEQNTTSTAETVRRGIMKLEEDLKK